MKYFAVYFLVAVFGSAAVNADGLFGGICILNQLSQAVLNAVKGLTDVELKNLGQKICVSTHCLVEDVKKIPNTLETVQTLRIQFCHGSATFVDSAICEIVNASGPDAEKNISKLVDHICEKARHLLDQLSPAVLAAINGLTKGELKSLGKIICKGTQCVVNDVKNVPTSLEILNPLRAQFCHGSATFVGSKICEIINGTGVDAEKELSKLIKTICDSVKPVLHVAQTQEGIL